MVPSYTKAQSALFSRFCYSLHRDNPVAALMKEDVSDQAAINDPG
jgi:hypothetical protein